MTEEQEQALKKANLLLGEYFDGFVIAVETEVMDGKEFKNSYLAEYKGGITQAIGLCERTKARLIKRCLDVAVEE